ncbi:MAG: hypothetical protein PHO20_01865 [Candidatus Peribacteraceae bacterium]|nr:hypothetical protein [Candidatus Peribacteraceae bacterium]MDD5739491.1 hypothetical protein [Candidatus Peribacteraceae bacterium]
MVPRLNQMSPEEIVALVDDYQPNWEHRARLYAALSGVDTKDQNQAIMDAYYKAQLALLRRDADSSRAHALVRQEEHRRFCDGLISEMNTVLNGALTPHLRAELAVIAPDLLDDLDNLPVALRMAAMGKAPR